MDEAADRDRVDEIARTWIGTKFHDHACVKGAGVDCAQILRAVFLEAGLIADFDIGPYSPQFFLHSGDERYLRFVQRFATEIPLERVRHGDVVLYHIGRCFAHAAIVIKPGWPHIIHAHSTTKVVRRAMGTSPHLGMTVVDKKYFSLW